VQIGEEFRHNRTPCSWCGRGLDAGVPVLNRTSIRDERMPESDWVAGCVYCGKPSVVVQSTLGFISLRQPTGQEMAWIDEQMGEELRLCREFARRRRSVWN
jgi:hypothetical protein